MSDEQEDIFFIYDCNAIQSEYETLEDAVLFCHPKPLGDMDDIYLLFGQLVGMVAFTESLTGAIPKIICLEKTKFAIIKQSHYLILLGSSLNNIPDGFLLKKLEKFVNVFTFYHGSLHRLRQRCGLKEDFLLELDLISSSYLAFAQSYGMIIASIFYRLQAVTFNKLSSMVYMNVCQILQACQRRDNVYSGCLFSESRLICSQLPVELAYYLQLLKPNQNNHPASVYYPGFDWPFGVRILQVYVTPTQYEQLLETSYLSPYKNKTRRIDSALKKMKHVKKLKTKTEIPKTFFTSKDSLWSDESLELMDSLGNSSTDLTSSLKSEQVCQCRYLINEELSASVSSNVESSVPRKLDDTSSLDRYGIRHTCAEKHGLPFSESDKKMHNQVSETDPQEEFLNSMSSVSINSHNLNVVGLSGITEETGRVKASHDDVNINMADGKNTDLVEEKLSDRKDLPKFVMSRKMSDELNIGSAGHEWVNSQKMSDSKKNKEQEDIVVTDDMKELHLYVQAHSNTILLLLMEPQSYDRHTFKSLWETILPQLGDIEAQVKSILSSSAEKVGKQKETFCYLKHNKLQNTCQSNIADVVSVQDRTLLEAINTIHQQFENSATMTDITLKTNLTSVLAHQSFSEEVFYQPRGNYKPTQGAPSNFDGAWSLDNRVNGKLKKLTDANLIL